MKQFRVHCSSNAVRRLHFYLHVCNLLIEDMWDQTVISFPFTLHLCWLACVVKLQHFVRLCVMYIFFIRHYSARSHTVLQILSRNSSVYFEQ